MAKLRVMTILGTRPEIIRLSRVMAKLDQYTEHTLVHTGQNYAFALSEVFFKELGIRLPDHQLACPGKTTIETIANILQAVDGLIKDVKPEAVLILGDTNSSLAAYAAKRRKVPIFHMEAGNRCFDQNVPEEINRKIVDHLADINMPYSERARENLIKEGFSPDRIITTGSPMKEVLDFYASEINRSDVVSRLKLTLHDYFVFSAHREEHVDDPMALEKIAKILAAVAQATKKRIIFSCHPRTRLRLDAMGTLPALVEVVEPFGFFDFIRVQRDSQAVISDSGGLTEESLLLNFPAVSIRQSYERAEGMDEAGVILGNLDANSVLNALAVLKEQRSAASRVVNVPREYDVDNVSEKVVRTLMSFTDYARRKVWGVR